MYPFRKYQANNITFYKIYGFYMYFGVKFGKPVLPKEIIDRWFVYREHEKHLSVENAFLLFAFHYCRLQRLFCVV
jgi:hypothetical protein